MILRALRCLLYWDWSVRVRSFDRVCEMVRQYPIRKDVSHQLEIAQIANALASVSIWYFKRVLCYQRSCCLVWMLRDAGIAANLVIGAQQWPPRTHAWVTVGDEVVGDLPHRVKGFDVIEVL